LKIFCVFQDHYDDERKKTVFRNTTPDLQDQDQHKDRFCWSETGFVLWPTVSDHITGQKPRWGRRDATLRTGFRSGYKC